MNNKEVKEKLINHLSQFNTLPYLFVGSGLSYRFAGLPNWRKLLEDIGLKYLAELDYQKVRINSNNDLIKMADGLAVEIHSNFFSDPKFDSVRHELLGIVQGQESIIKFLIAKHLTALEENFDPKQTEVKVFEKAKIEGIITTNYDTLLEKIFPGFKPKINQEDIIFSSDLEESFILKIHGSATNPESLVLTSADYSNFEKTKTFISAKLLTILADHPIVFLGYSINDKNIGDIINSMISCLTDQKLAQFSNRLIMVDYSDSEEFTYESSHRQFDGKVIPLTRISGKDFMPIFEALSEIKPVIPINVVRKLKHMIFEFVKAPKRNSRNIFVLPDDKLNDPNLLKNLDVAIGFGLNDLARKGVIGLQIFDLLDDIVNDSLPKVQHETILMQWMNNRQNFNNSSFTPVFKYLSSLKLLNSDGSVKTLDHNGIDIMNKITLDSYKIESLKKTYGNKFSKLNISQVIENHPDKALDAICFLDPKNIDLSILKLYLSERLKEVESELSGPEFSKIRKAICLYDFLKYSNRA